LFVTLLISILIVLLGTLTVIFHIGKFLFCLTGGHIYASGSGRTIISGLG